MGGKSAKAKISRYNMSIHYGICHAPVDQVEAILVGEKEAWSGQITNNTTLNISKEGLFGGMKKEGGIGGAVEIMFGGSDQRVSADLAGRLRGSPLSVPGYRGILSAFFRGHGSPRGFYWAASNPYLKPIWFRIRSIPRDLGGPHAEVPRGTPFNPDDYPESELRITPPDYSQLDANPAHIIYACYTNTDWGMGEDPQMIDQASFLQAADTLWHEYLGLSLQWAQSGSIEDFVNIILQHINGAVFTHPRTGLITLRLIRDDFDVDTLRTITPDNAALTSFSRKAWGETINEVKVTWTNPQGEGEETVYSQDLGNIAMQGSVVSDSKNFYGVRYSALAQRLADRELRAASAPLCSAEAELTDRSFRDITPYEVVKLDWPEYGIKGMVMRVTNVSYGTSDRPGIKVALMEDVFSLPQSAFTQPPGSSWIDPAQEPVPVSTARIVPAPAYSLIQEEVPLEDLQFPSTFVSVLVPSPYVAGSVSHSVYLKHATAGGELEWEEVADSEPFAGWGEITLGLRAESSSMIPRLRDVMGDSPSANYIMIIGPDYAPVEDLELALITTVDLNSGDLYLRRGILDTVPKNWPSGTGAWFVPLSFFDPLPVELTVGQSVNIRVSTNTSLGRTDDDTSPQFSTPAKPRATKPLRPANVKINGTAYGVVPAANILDVSWSHRNRFLEDEQILSWESGSTPPEPGVTYRVEIDAYGPTGPVELDWLTRNVGSDTTYSLDLDEDIPPEGTDRLQVRVVAVRDGERSWQSYEMEVEYEAPEEPEVPEP